MEAKVILTRDGSHTVETAAGLTYHSTFGAMQESRHIFIEAGLRAWSGDGPVRVFEMGFGTGLNALLTSMEGMEVHYETVESAPLPLSVVRQLSYCDESLLVMHEAAWDSAVLIRPGFLFYKALADIRGYRLGSPADVVYFDAFDPVAQPELWTEGVFANLYAQMAPGAVLVTYCSKGVVRRALQQVGFSVEKIPGPPGKREFLRAMRMYS